MHRSLMERKTNWKTVYPLQQQLRRLEQQKHGKDIQHVSQSRRQKRKVKHVGLERKIKSVRLKRKVTRARLRRRGKSLRQKRTERVLEALIEKKEKTLD